MLVDFKIHKQSSQSKDTNTKLSPQRFPSSLVKKIAHIIITTKNIPTKSQHVLAPQHDGRSRAFDYE